MEREVTSTNSQVLNQAASWANWAVGAIGAKFYKSANKPPPEPPTSTSSQNTSKENTPVPTEKTKANIKAKESNNELIDFGAADDKAEGDGWNDDDDDWMAQNRIWKLMAPNTNKLWIYFGETKRLLASFCLFYL